MSDEMSDALRRARESWRFRGDERPEFADEPGPGQESVWDYPRPPRVEADDREIVVAAADTVVARTTEAVRVLETASPPGFYLPPEAIDASYLEPGAGSSFCEWKGRAQYWTVRIGSHVYENVGWGYPDPLPGFESMKDYVSFYPGRLRCVVGDEQAHPQPGEFYGGWVTSELVGPFKGAPGTEWW